MNIPVCFLPCVRLTQPATPQLHAANTEGPFLFSRSYGVSSKKGRRLNHKMAFNAILPLSL